jgi:rhodanese-related sulfurtransferase
MHRINTDDLHERFKNDDGKHTILDARGPAEYAAGHVPGAINIPHTELAGRLDEVPKDQPVYVHCAMGGRAQAAAALLEQHGYDVWCVADGGMRDWTEKGFPTNTP